MMNFGSEGTPEGKRGKFKTEIIFAQCKCFWEAVAMVCCGVQKALRSAHPSPRVLRESLVTQRSSTKHQRRQERAGDKSVRLYIQFKDSAHPELTDMDALLRKRNGRDVPAKSHKRRKKLASSLKRLISVMYATWITPANSTSVWRLLPQGSLQRSGNYAFNVGQRIIRINTKSYQCPLAQSPGRRWQTRAGHLCERSSVPLPTAFVKSFGVC